MSIAKKLLFFCAAAVLTAACSKTQDSKAPAKVPVRMNAGTYTETVSGMSEGLTVEVKISEYKIESVKITSHQETEGISDVPISTIPEEIVKKQSLSVDTVAGATLTSKGILTAVENAIKNAGGNPADFK